MGNTEFDHIDRLYHYTTVESLALILKNRTLRLNPLDKMDDLQEAQSQSRQINVGPKSCDVSNLN